MKKILALAASLLALNLMPVFAQSGFPPNQNPPGNFPSASFQQRLQAIQTSATLLPAEAPPLTKFDLDFPGGPPKELVAAIEKATGKPLNVIIADEAADVKLPPIKVSQVDVANLFKTLSENSKKYLNNEMVRNYGFQTIDQRPSDNSLWTFYSYTKPNVQTQFSLDFPGGTPTELVKAIDKAMGKPLNVIINKEDENMELPPLKMDDVYLPQLFSALEAASRKTIAVDSGNGIRGFGSYSQFTTGYGFKSADGSMNDNSIWYFQVDKPSLPPVVSTQKVAQFYSLAPYLDRGFTVDDITTAIQTGWKMSGESSPPELNYHKETKLLIAYGEPGKLLTIDNVLRTLPSSNATRDELNSLWGNVHGLQKAMEDLKKVTAAPEEKSGK